MWKKDFLLHGIYLKNSADSYLNFSTSFTSLIRAYSRKLGHACNFSEKGQKQGKIFKNFGKNVQIWKNFQKGQPHACDYRMRETARICPAHCLTSFSCIDHLLHCYAPSFYSILFNIDVILSINPPAVVSLETLMSIIRTC